MDASVVWDARHCEYRIAKAPVTGNLSTDPTRKIDELPFVVEFDLRNNQAVVPPRVYVHLPKVLAVGDFIAGLLNWSVRTERENCIGVRYRDLVFEFLPCSLAPIRLYREPTFVVDPPDANLHRCCGKVALTD